jgi:hypothetical protein
VDRVTALIVSGGGDPAEQPAPGVPVVDRGAAGLIVDVPHVDPAARARFARPAPFPLDALAWTGTGRPPVVTGFDTGAKFIVERHIGWLADDDDVAKADPRDVVKQVSFLQASAGTGLDEFRSHYRHHVEVARKHMPALWQYIQNDIVEIVDRGVDAARGFVAISELWFRSTDDFLHRYFPSAADEAEFRSQEGFLDLSKAFSFISTSYESS